MVDSAPASAPVVRPDGEPPLLSYEQVEHELKTPLTSIRSLSEILLDCPDLASDERERFLRILLAENERLTRAVDRLLGAPAFQKVLG